MIGEELTTLFGDSQKFGENSMVGYLTLFKVYLIEMYTAVTLTLHSTIRMPMLSKILTELQENNGHLETQRGYLQVLRKYCKYLQVLQVLASTCKLPAGYSQVSHVTRCDLQMSQVSLMSANWLASAKTCK